MKRQRVTPQVPTDPTAANLAAALQCAASGFTVFPCDPATKRPRVKWKEAATSDPDQVRRLWREFPDAVPALRTGLPGGVAVVDLDVKEGKDGLASYRSLGLDPEAAGLVVRTGGGGRHLYFAHEAGLRNGVNVRDLPGVDIRAAGGYVIAPGAVTHAGAYTVLGGSLETVALTGLGRFPAALRTPEGPPEDAPQSPSDVDLPTLREALSYVPNDGPYSDWVEVLMALHHATGGSDEGLALALGWSAGYPGFSVREVREKWRSFGRRDGLQITADTLLAKARSHGWQTIDADAFDDLDEEEPAEEPAPSPSGLAFLSPGDCAALTPRDYIVKGLIGPGQVGCIFGEPGAGKSVIAPRLAYAVAQGEEVFGLRTRKGGVFYVACEDESGMAARVTALHGDLRAADGFLLVTGCSDLFSPSTIKGKGSPDLEALRRRVKADRPRLIVVDTLAMAMPGLEENDATGMARVVAIGRVLARHGAAVVFVHHGTKAEGSTPRGHSVFNGALDFSIMVRPADQAGIVRGAIKKNRNGPPNLDIAFRIGSRTVGEDVDGDAITAPICEPCDPLDGEAPVALSGAESAALGLLTEMADAEGRVDEATWREAAISGVAVSASDDRANRRKAVNRAIQGLARKGLITTGGGSFQIVSRAIAPVEFDDEESEDDLV